MMGFKINPLQQYHPIQAPTVQKEVKQQATNFKDILSGTQDIKVSKHAKQRLSERNIQINDNQWEVISKKMQEARKKGVTDSVVITKQATLLVSTKNNTVVTAMNNEEATNKIFTNINGTILINE